ncbi:zinc finger CCCH domain-containing protein 58-like [Raphanus sativus]|uniref:Zinc finger CCCH domain-containing protein 58-like n=1 Tax=Raphanus sativus TaxID=3726 RepID=A0A6J0LVQ7_RAPSA|nr:zinc finger CCCH domain-containing protein 58-like [Raphanus sativus]
MEQHGSGGTGEEGSLSDPGTNTTGMEASMSRLGLGGGGSESYPERPDEPDCVYYLRTGVCGYGSKCQFNHPPNRPPVSGDLRTEAGEVPERMGQPVCQHFMRTGDCKFGASCKYHHPRQGSGGGGGGDSVTSPISFNHMGFPLRPGEKECPYYMRTGQCKFGSTCKFHHPVPPGDHQAPSQHPLPTSPPAIYPSQQFGVVVPRPYVTYSQMVLSPGMVGWNPYQPSTGTQPSPVYGTKPLSPSAPAYQSGSPSSNKEQSFPQRPGQPECTYFLRTGDCKYGTSCRYHHPLEAASPKGISLSHIGLPLRPGTAQCSHFAQHGICKLGPACKFDHSSSLSTLAPSLSSSSDQGTEVHSSSSIKPKTTASGESETVAAGVSSSSSMTGGVSNSKPAESKNGDSAKHSG